MKKILLYVIFISIIISCKVKKETSETDDLSKVEIIPTSYTVLNDTSILNDCIDIAIYKDYLLVYSFVDGKYIQVYDKNSGKHIKSILKEGRGPGEVSPFVNFSVNVNTGKFSWYNINEEKYTCFDLDPVISNDQYIKYIETRHPNYRVTQIFEGNDRIIGIGEFINFKRTRLVLVNSDSVIFKSNYIPDLPEYKLENIDLGFFGNIFWHFSPLNNKLVSGNYNGLVLEIYDVDNTEIKISSVKVFEKPIYSMNERNNRPESIEGESICGFTRIYVTSENIYASYNGSTDDLNFVDKIIEFDLDGNPLRILKFDNISITGICVDESRDRNRIYMTVVNDDRDFFIVYADI